MRTQSKRLAFDAVVGVAAVVVLLLLPVYPTHVIRATTTVSGRTEFSPRPKERSTLLEVLREWTPHYVGLALDDGQIEHRHPLKWLPVYAAAWLLLVGLGHGAACLLFRSRDHAQERPGAKPAPRSAGH